MTLGLGKKRVFWVLSMITVSVSAPAFAYIPPSQYIVKQFTQKHRRVKRIQISHQVSGFDEGELSGVSFREVAIYDYRLRVLQSRVYDEGGIELYAEERSLMLDLPPEAELQSGVDEDGRADFGSKREPAAREKERIPPLPIYNANFPVANFLLLENVPENLIAALIHHEIPIQTEKDLVSLPTEVERRQAEKTAIRRWEKKIAWVIGDPKSFERPQLWWEKDVFLPLRLWIRKSPTEDKTIEIRFQNYRFTQTFPYPREILVLEKEVPVVQSALDQIVIDPKLSKKFPERLNPGLTEAGKNSSEKIQKLIEAYYAVLR